MSFKAGDRVRLNEKGLSAFTNFDGTNNTDLEVGALGTISASLNLFHVDMWYVKWDEFDPDYATDGLCIMERDEMESV